MPFKRNVEVGRVALINFGAEAGKLVVIVDVLDQNRILVDRPDEVRKVVSLKRVALTDLTIDIPRSAPKKSVTKALEANDTFAKFATSAWGKKLAARAAKASSTDLQRHLAHQAKVSRNSKVRAAFNKLKASA